MWARQYRSALTDLAIDYSSGTLASINLQFLCVACQDLNTLVLIFRSVYKDSSSIIVRSKHVGDRTLRKASLVDFKLNSLSTSFAMIDKARKS